MFNPPLFRTAIAVLAAAASPALAAGAKPISITVPAASVKDDTSRICMPRSILGAKADKALPQTMCGTRAEWGARGVTIVTK